MFRHMIALVVIGLAASLVGAQTPRDLQVLGDRKKVESEGFWIYNDLAKGFAEAKKTGKPLFVILRCVPCVECVKLDDDLVNQDPHVKPLLEKFVCVRLVSTNGLDLALFQYDYDQSFAAFFLNADGTIYGRFGTRSHRTTWANDVSIDGLAKALAGALELHGQYPRNRDELSKKKGAAPEIASPEKYPTLKDRYTSKINFEDKVAQSCIHCHQIGDAQKQLARSRKEPLTEAILFPYPHPKALGLILDPAEKATVLRVEKDTPAAQSGFQAGDVLLKLDGQPLLSLADVQWVLHHASGAGAALVAQVRRGEKTLDVTLTLPKGWRQLDDLSWRASSWGLRRMATGGMLLQSLTPEERKTAGLPETGMALRVERVGAFGPHAAAKNAGVLAKDILVSYDEHTDLTRETDLFAYSLTQRKPGEQVSITLLRDGKKLTLKLPMQE